VSPSSAGNGNAETQGSRPTISASVAEAAAARRAQS
jgi:hypothetical protein